MSTPAWIGFAVIAAGLSGLVGRMIFVSSGPNDKRRNEERHCLACKRVTIWHPTKGCTVCRSLDSFF